ncbi:MAG: hypothetical protein IJO24_00165 [Clostridia bacterium]|nr:hypothetical protein [Clostridia bacterium]
MKKAIVAIVTVVVMLCSLTVSVSAAVEQYNNKGFQIYPNDDFIKDTEWAEKYGYVDYWHTEDYGIEMILIDTEFPESEFMDKHPDEPHYQCHILHDDVYGYASDIISEETIEINGNIGVKRMYEKKVKHSEEDEWESFSAVKYVFEKEDKYYEVCFYIHNETLYGFYPDMIMEEFNISRYTAMYDFLYTGMKFLPYIVIAAVCVFLIKRKLR